MEDRTKQFLARLPERVHDALEEAAAKERRSKNAQLVVILEKYFGFNAEMKQEGEAA